jgi:hypothetical protein
MRYIIRTREDPAALTAFLDSVNDDPCITVVDRIGPAGQVHTAVIELTEEKARLLEQRLRHSDQLLFERDRPLTPNP